MADLTPEEVGANAAQVQAESIADKAHKASIDKLDIVDPTSRPAPARIDEPEAPAAPAAPAAPKISEDQLRRAWELGISPEEAKSYEPSALDRTINILYRQRQQQYVPQQQLQQQQTQEEEDILGEEFRETYQQPIVEALEKIHKTSQHKIRELESKLNVTASQAQAYEAQEADRQIEQYFASAPEEIKSIYGTGTIYELGQHSPEYAARMEVVDEARRMRNGYLVEGKQPPSVHMLMERASRAVHGTRAVAGVERGVADRIRNRQGQFIARPDNREMESQSSAKTMTPEQREAYAIKRLGQRMAARA